MSQGWRKLGFQKAWWWMEQILVVGGFVYLGAGTMGRVPRNSRRGRLWEEGQVRRCLDQQGTPTEQAPVVTQVVLYQPRVARVRKGLNKSCWSTLAPELGWTFPSGQTPAELPGAGEMWRNNSWQAGLKTGIGSGTSLRWMGASLVTITQLASTGF